MVSIFNGFSNASLDNLAEANTGKPEGKKQLFLLEVWHKVRKGKSGCDAPLIPENELHRISVGLGQEPDSLRNIFLNGNILSFHLDNGETVEKEVHRAGN